ncbi:MAG: tyrosine-type recombinase/integrase [Gammaproteobacteria bacterium]|nr:tyrosine-type recombinase/integrase [Gammaproteobacteria bacterium]
MALCKRGKIWWIRICHGGKRVQHSTGTSDKVAAKRLHDQIKADLWKDIHLGEKPQKTWMQAVTRWIAEAQHKRSLNDDKAHLRWVSPYLKKFLLDQINRDMLSDIAEKKLAEGGKPSTVNRMLEVIRAIFRKAEREWEWLDKAPQIRMLKENTKRIRWLNYEEANRLINELPTHLADLAIFSLATGLRKANVAGLQWSEVDLIRRHALIHPDQAKTKKAIPVPLNKTAVEVIRKQLGKHQQFVFTYDGKRIIQCNTKAWKKALARAGIENFRWHDLRHTWARWHVQNGTSLQELQQLGGWANFEMVLRYAHLSSDHLKEAAEHTNGYNLGTLQKGVANGNL